MDMMRLPATGTEVEELLRVVRAALMRAIGSVPLARAKAAYAANPSLTVRELARAAGVGRGTAHNAMLAAKQETGRGGPARGNGDEKCEMKGRRARQAR